MSTLILSVDYIFGDTATTVNLKKVTNSIGEDVTERFISYAKNKNVDLSQKESLEKAAGEFAKEFNDVL